MMNVKEVAQSMHISERAIQKKFKKYEEQLKPWLTYTDGQWLFDENGLDELRNIGTRKKPTANVPRTELMYQTNELKNENEHLKRIIEEKDHLIAFLESSLEREKKLNDDLMQQLQLANRKWWQKLLPGGNEK